MEVQINDERVVTAVRAAVAGGDHALERQREADQYWKDDGSIVTEADEEAENIIRDVLDERSSAKPVGEEHGGESDDAERYWLIDPIDGTKNYARGQPTYNTSVALVEEGRPVAGCVYLPATGDVFYAGRGLGAYRNERQIRSTDIDDPDDAYSLIDGYFEQGSNTVLQAIDGWTQRKNAGALTLASIAAGWNDTAALGSLEPWDMGAGVLLVEEAGGVVKTVASRETAWNAVRYGDCVATNGSDTLTDDLIRKIRETSS